ncbi:MAG: hypothetical protein RLY16_1444 [Bacteroidota bacterium]|jgi:glycosyltransferase involved in cell wall biosynthesis
MLKILLLNDTLIKGGKERRIVELLKYSKAHFPVQFELVFMHQTIDYPEINEVGYPIHILDWNNKQFLKGYKKLKGICDAFQPDIIHSWSSMTDILSVILKWQIKKPFITSMIAQALPKATLRDKDYFRSKIAFPFADKITSNTKAGITSFHAPQQKSLCIYNGFNYNRLNNLIDPNTLRNQLGLQNKFIIGMVAAFEPRKDYFTVIEAAKKLSIQHADRIAFVLIGGGAMQEEVKAQAGEWLNKTIFFTGKLNNVESYINLFNIGILCTNSDVHGEGISNSILECMALAKPIIATEGGGTAEIVQHRTTGFLIAPKSPDVLAEKIQQLMHDDQLAIQMGQAGKKIIQEQFTIEKMCNTFFATYQELASK